MDSDTRPARDIGLLCEAFIRVATWPYLSKRETQRWITQLHAVIEQDAARSPVPGEETQDA